MRFSFAQLFTAPLNQSGMNKYYCPVSLLQLYLLIRTHLFDCSFCTLEHSCKSYSLLVNNLIPLSNVSFNQPQHFSQWSIKTWSTSYKFHCILVGLYIGITLEDAQKTRRSRLKHYVVNITKIPQKRDSSVQINILSIDLNDGSRNILVFPYSGGSLVGMLHISFLWFFERQNTKIQSHAFDSCYIAMLKGSVLEIMIGVTFSLHTFHPTTETSGSFIVN